MSERDQLERRQVAALETIARACVVVANHVLGGMSPEDVEEAKREAIALARDLRRSRKNLDAAIDAAKDK